MLYFPQLSTGSCAQYPVTRTTVMRSVVNRMADESAICLADPDRRAVRWELRYRSLTDAERSVLEALFCEAGGPLRTFTYLDPAANLLRWSEDFSQDVWRNDGMLQIANGRFTNAAQVFQGVEQTVAGPGWYQYCLSASVRGGSLRLSLRNADGNISSNARAGAGWRQVLCSGAIAGTSEEVRCRIEVAPGESVEVREVMLAAQPMPASYRVSGSHSGVHRSTRFAEDRLVFNAEGPNLHSVVVRLISSVERV
jgi:hypothetical protein